MMTNINHNEVDVTLTKKIQSPPIGHVLYTYTDISKYLKNATAFITEGLMHGHTILFMDRSEYFAAIKEDLEQIGYSKEQLDDIYFIDSNQIYEPEADFNPNQVIENMAHLIYPHVKAGNILRGWGLVTWREQDEQTLTSCLALHEKNVEKVFSEIADVTGDFINVCAYDSASLSGVLYNELLQTHAYHMTDTVLSHSNLYNRTPISFPKILEQFEAENNVRYNHIRREKITTAGELAANVAHEFHNSLSVMKGRLQLLDKIDDASDPYSRHVESMKKEIKRMEQTASEYLSLAKPHVETRKTVNLSQLIGDLKHHIEGDQDIKGIDIVTRMDHDETLLTCDEDQLTHVFYNLIKNAIEAMDEGTITLDLKETADVIYVDVSDDGPGIPDDILHQIGEPFMTSKKDGTGLGLLISEKIIREHNGSLFVKTEIDSGTTFTISLPK